MTESLEVDLDEALMTRAEARASELGVTPAEYINRLVRQNLDAHAHSAGIPEDERPFDISEMFDLGASAEPTDIAKSKDKLIGEAVWEEHLRKTGRADSSDSKTAGSRNSVEPRAVRMYRVP
jgi:hypothetical protein